MAHRIAWEQLFLPNRLREMKVDAALYPVFIKPALSRAPAAVVIHDAFIKVYPELIERSRRWHLDAMIERSVRTTSARIIVDVIEQDIRGR